MRSLFDRISNPLLVDSNTTEIENRNTELRSIENELNRLLNSRSYFSGNAQKSKTILDYGLNSIVSAGSSRSSCIADVVNNVQMAIKTYEPRLINPVVHGDYLESEPTKLMVTVVGTLRESMSPIQFRIPLAINNGEL